MESVSIVTHTMLLLVYDAVIQIQKHAF